MSNVADNTLLQQQAAQRAEAMRQAQKASKPQSEASVKFAEVLKNQQKSTQPKSSSKLLTDNPVGGAEVVKSALRSNNAGKSQSKLAVAANASSGANSGSTSTSGSSSGSSTSSEVGALGGSTDTNATMAASYRMMEMNQDFNLQYLNLQQNMQAESRQFTAMSNVSKTKQDTAKNSLSNVK